MVPGAATSTPTAGYANQGIPTSVEGDGQFITVSDNTVNFGEKSWLSEENIQDVDYDIHVAAQRDISAGVNANKSIYIKDMQITYPGGGVSVIFPVADVVIEYRPTTGVETQRKTNDKKSSFRNGYLVTYASLGMPEAVFKSLAGKVLPKSGFRDISKLVPKVRYNDGYAWMPIKVPDQRPVNVWGLDENTGEPTHLGKIVEVFKSVKKSLLGYATLSMRLKHIVGTGLGPRQFEMAATLTSFQAIDIASKSSPPLTDAVAKLTVSKAMSQRLFKCLNDSTTTSGNTDVGITGDDIQDLEEGMGEYRLDGDNAEDDDPIFGSNNESSAERKFKHGQDSHQTLTDVPSAGAAGREVGK